MRIRQPPRPEQPTELYYRRLGWRQRMVRLAVSTAWMAEQTRAAVCPTDRGGLQEDEVVAPVGFDAVFVNLALRSSSAGRRRTRARHVPAGMAQRSAGRSRRGWSDERWPHRRSRPLLRAFLYLAARARCWQKARPLPTTTAGRLRERLRTRLSSDRLLSTDLFRSFWGMAM